MVLWPTCAADGNQNGRLDLQDRLVWAGRFRGNVSANSADFNADGVVDAADYTVWRDSVGVPNDLRGDSNGAGNVNSLDYQNWRSSFGQLPLTASQTSVLATPEPNAIRLAGIVAMLVAVARAIRRSVNRQSLRLLRKAPSRTLLRVRRLMSPAMVAMLPLLISSTSSATWDNVTGIKNGPEAVEESNNPWGGNFLGVSGGRLTFLGEVHLGGDLHVSNGGFGPSSVIVDGSLTQTAGLHFSVRDGSTLTTLGKISLQSANTELRAEGGSRIVAGDLSDGQVTARYFGVAQESEVVIRDFIGLGDFGVSSGSNVRLGSFSQNTGHFVITELATLSVERSYVSQIESRPHLLNGAAALIQGGWESRGISASSGASLAVGSLRTHGDMDIVTDARVNVLGDYLQDAGYLRVAYGAAALNVGGSLNYNGPEFRVFSGGRVNIGLPATSTIQAGRIQLDEGAQVTAKTVTSHGDTDVVGDAKLSTLGNYVQDAGYLRVAYGAAALNVGGSLNYSGPEFRIFSGGRLNIGSPATSVIEAGRIQLDEGAQVIANTVTSHGDTDIVGDAKLSTLGNYVQDAGYLRVAYGSAALNVGGSLNYSGPEFRVFSGGRLNIGSPATSVIEAGRIQLDEGAQVIANTVTSHGDTDIVGDAKLSTLGNYVQDAGYLRIAYGTAALNVGGSLNYSGPEFRIFSDGNVNVVGNVVIERGELKGDSVLTSPNVFLYPDARLTEFVTVSGKLWNGGTVAPGSGIGTQMINGTYHQGAYAALEIGIAGPGGNNGRLSVSGFAELGGRLDVPILGSYVPAIGDEIAFFDAGAIAGSLSMVTSPNLHTVAPDRAIEVFRQGNEMRLRFVAPDATKSMTATSAQVDWFAPSNWSAGGIPNGRSILSLTNSNAAPFSPQAIYFGEGDNLTEEKVQVHDLSIIGGNAPLTLSIGFAGRSLQHVESKLRPVGALSWRVVNSRPARLIYGTVGPCNSTMEGGPSCEPKELRAAPALGTRPTQVFRRFS